MVEAPTDAVSVYDGAVADWVAGPEKVYDALARRLLATVGTSIEGATCLDVGAGTGAVSRLLAERGALTVEADLSASMLRCRRALRPPAVVADLRRLPVRSGVVDLGVAAFVLNHLSPVEAALAELARVLRPDGRLLASTWPAGPAAVKDTADRVMRAHGWEPPAWYAAMREDRATTGHPEHMLRACAAVGLAGSVEVAVIDAALPVEAIVAWRARLPHTAWWFGSLDGHACAVVRDELRAALCRLAQLRLRVLVIDVRRVA